MFFYVAFLYTCQVFYIYVEQNHQCAWLAKKNQKKLHSLYQSEQQQHESPKYS